MPKPHAQRDADISKQEYKNILLGHVRESMGRPEAGVYRKLCHSVRLIVCCNSERLDKSRRGWLIHKLRNKCNKLGLFPLFLNRKIAKNLEDFFFRIRFL
jgi:hypothetical protein